MSLPFTTVAQKTHSSRDTNFTPQQELAGFTVPDGFTVELVASEEEGVVNPIDLTFDDAGRLWTQTARMYPLDPVKDIQWNELQELIENPEAQKNDPRFKRIQDLYQGEIRGEDKILVLSNLNNEGTADVAEWASGLAIPQSILPYKNGAYVAQGSELFFLEDNDNDGRADERDPLFTGFGFTDSHTMSHTLVRGPGGWIHFSQGGLNKGKVSAVKSDVQLDIDYSKIVRFSLDGKQIKLVSSGLNNIWGFQLRHNGQWYATEANDLGYSVVPMEPGTGFPGLGNDRLRPYQPFMPPLHEFRVGGTGISGLAFADDASGVSFPKKWNNVALLANPITSTINAVRIVRNPDGSVTAEHLPDFLTSEDEFFRPVNMEFGPDGCLYIADWYNKIISHNELPTTHPDRDKSHGRIWRVCHESQQPREVPNLYEVKTADLVGHLKSPYLWEKRAAWHQISDRPRGETTRLADDLVALAADQSRDEVTRIHALWSLEGIHHYDGELISSLLESSSGNLRREAVRSLASFSLGPAQVAPQLNGLVEDKNAMVRSQVLRTLANINAANQATIGILVQACKPDIPGNEMGGSYERTFERYLARKALEQYPGELQAYLDSVSAGDVPPRNLLWASQALPEEQRETAFLELWPQVDMKTLNEPTFISITKMLDNKQIADMVAPVIHNPDQAETYTNFAVQNQSRVQSPELVRLLRVPVQKLLQSGNESEINLALDAIGRFGMQGFSGDIEPLINTQSSDETLNLALAALENQPKENKAVFTQIFNNETLDFDTRVNALHNMVKADAEVGSQAVQSWISELGTGQKQELTSVLSTSDQGASLLLGLYERGRIDTEAFDLPTAERISNGNPSDSRSLDLLQAVEQREKKKRKAFKQKLDRYMKIVEQKEGNISNGEKLFQTCLTCHSVGSRGQDIAPALDGSAYRDTEALFTALIDPNAAVETGYEVYRVTQKDGSIIEGYLVQQDEQGTTIAFMGGATVFVEKESIQSEGFISGRSFMPEGLIEGYTDQEIADLISYIRTLE
ncbi:c-type cytochrome [Halalkalibaculum sp. DA384]|uniref:DUF7133 domain-containing protein n=1 Tax=Halalkalibaculum sp. DA384 TaxID=3373606 RepID=UPI00375447A5